MINFRKWGEDRLEIDLIDYEIIFLWTGTCSWGDRFIYEWSKPIYKCSDQFISYDDFDANSIYELSQLNHKLVLEVVRLYILIL